MALSIYDWQLLKLLIMNLLKLLSTHHSLLTQKYLCFLCKVEWAIHRFSRCLNEFNIQRKVPFPFKLSFKFPRSNPSYLLHSFQVMYSKSHRRFQCLLVFQVIYRFLVCEMVRVHHLLNKSPLEEYLSFHQLSP